jgi:hypothetical protein
MKLALSSRFASVQDWNDAFLALWTHRYDYLWAEHPSPSDLCEIPARGRPDWKTESRHPLSDRLIQQGAYLYGVRFGQTTRYILLDIDKDSRYHPLRDRFAWKRMVATLEALGLVQAVICTSSYSGGLHLYFPFEEEQKTWAIALAVKTLLENTGFKLAPGQLEVFPNCKPYATTGEPSLYNGHRLPMQAGSYLLNQDLQMIWGDQQTFVQHWQLAQQRNSIDEKAVDRIIKAARRKQYRITGKADKFLNDLNAEIEQGWTGYGQTNRLLGRIAMRSYIFGHVLNDRQPLAGDALVDDVLAIARSLPGYEDWCQHCHEIEKRAKDWADSVEQSHYYPYGTGKPQTEANPSNSSNAELSHNKKIELEARERIRRAVADLMEKEALPMGITERFDALILYGISGQTLYRHRDLWHPRHLQNETIDELQSDAGQDCSWAASCPDNHTNLLVGNGCNSLSDRASSHFGQDEYSKNGCNFLPSENLSHSEPRNMTTEEGVAYIKQVLAQVKARSQAEKVKKGERNDGQSQLELRFME